MFLRKRPQLPALPSMRLNTLRARSKPSVSASLTDSATPSPTESTHGTSTSAGGATSVSDPDDYADSLAAKPESSATMRSKSSTTTRASDKASHAGHRRASSRVRKPTAKAQALGGSRSYSPPLLDTVVVEPLTVRSGLSSNKEPSATVPPPKDVPEKVQPEPEVPETPSAANRIRTKTPSPPDVAGEESRADLAETPSRRISQRERKPTAKVLSESSTAQKRPAADDAQEAPPRKSARISYSGARVPSKLRYSISAENSEADDAGGVERAPTSETPTTIKSKIIVLKSKRLAEVFGPPKPSKPDGSSPSSKRKSRRRSKRGHVTTDGVIAKPNPAPVEIPGSCNLSCLPPSSRLLAFAEIAFQMPDEEDENEATVPGSVYDWRMYTQVWCRCDQGQQLKSDRTGSVELARALMPNPVSQGTSYDPIDLSSSQTPEAELLSTPVNTVLRATDAERLSQRFAGPPNHSTGQTPNGAPATSGMTTRDEFVASASHRPSEKYASLYEGPSRNVAYPMSHPVTTRRTYEDRLRDDHNALTDIRKRAAARGISWNFNMTFDDIHALIMDAEEREQQQQQAQYRQQVISPPQSVIDRVVENVESPSGFGVLLPPRGALQARRFGSIQRSHKDSFAAAAAANAAAEVAQERPRSSTTPRNISFVEETNPANPSRNRRPSSPSRPKSSRFRVDPRGLRGESPGPGTIINMSEKLEAAEFKKKAAELERLASAMRQFEEYQMREEQQWEERRNEWRQRREQEGQRLNGLGHEQP
ncbi:uncharacterized protein A1O5_12286 [Cladophialophora psammophila CBS 110553]|uniref:Uncharacterized protein n=1 Tax=Cladophialophora psammophila CBS 110553 TaxID=1182543 RepID=W9W334_9EURO|nr:uncharacterized protein A1O5_12286 [Cladophialophora psammophila CBS 110553]EXJ59405.1 hypothetical protein A1O5_12286 [Cladophialophora psammophila CBS 110553]